MPLICDYCGRRNPETNTICQECGAELSANAAPAGGESVPEPNPSSGGTIHEPQAVGTAPRQQPRGSESPGRGALSLRMAAVYGTVTAGLVLLGVPVAFHRYSVAFLPLVALCTALALAAGSVALFRNRLWGQRLFLITAPWGPLALAISLKSILWTEDIPYTVLLVPIYAVLAFLLSRGSVLSRLQARAGEALSAGDPVPVGPGTWLSSADRTRISWAARGGIPAAWCAAVAVILSVIVHSSSPSSGGLGALGAWVDAMVLTDTLLAQYLLGLISVSVPTNPPRQLAPPTEDRVATSVTPGHTPQTAEDLPAASHAHADQPLAAGTVFWVSQEQSRREFASIPGLLSALEGGQISPTDEVSHCRGTQQVTAGRFRECVLIEGEEGLTRLFGIKKQTGVKPPR